MLARTDVAGVVVTAGTGIIEEGSYLCELLNRTSKPIVWTGAQFSADMLDTDGPRNLLNSVRVAVSPELMPDDGQLVDLFHQWTPNLEDRRRILVDTPTRLFDCA